MVLLELSTCRPFFVPGSLDGGSDGRSLHRDATLQASFDFGRSATRLRNVGL